MPHRPRTVSRPLVAGERWTIHAVRGLVDTASPLGARWISDEACEDQFSREVMDAQRALFHEVDTPWPDGGEGPVRMLAGEGRTPSLVWHAQAIGVLLELGFLPTAKCIREHLNILERRLKPINCHNPEESPEDDGWLLRTRHVAWVLACLAEMPQFKLAPGDPTDLRRELEAAMEQHGRIIRTAATYLLGMGSDGPATWIGLREGEAVWSEVWQERKPNLLNTVYSALGLCRAERHGYLQDLVEPHPGHISRATELFGDLLRGVVVEATSKGPEVRWRRVWGELWAKHDLPSGVIALLALALMEYSSLLLEASVPGAEEEMRALEARNRAQRLAHVLVCRDQRKKTRWSSTADAFFSEKAEGAWFTPTYSLGLRAILETGVVHPGDPLVRRGFKIIEGLATERHHGGEVVQTWIDPTRSPPMRDEAAGAHQHAVANFESIIVNDAVARGRVNAAGLHAAGMAWAGLRRAAARVDPRELLWLAAKKRPASPFKVIDVTPENESWTLTLIGDGGLHAYREQARVVTETLYFFRALASFDRPASSQEIAQLVTKLSGAAEPPLDASNVPNKIWRINYQFGTALIASVDDDRHLLTALLRLPAELDAPR
jgi:hypothetical protein